MGRRKKWLLADAGQFARLRRRLVRTADEMTPDILLWAPELSDQQLICTLEAALTLEPLALHEPTAIRIELDPRAVLLGTPSFLHQMTARYEGSRELWQARPTPHPRLMLEGKVGVSTITAECWFGCYMFDSFERLGRDLLDQARAALPLLEPEVRSFNAELPDFCPAYVMERSEELVRWRKRGQQMRERRKRRTAFDATEPPIDPILPAWKVLAQQLIKASR